MDVQQPKRYSDELGKRIKLVSRHDDRSPVYLLTWHLSAMGRVTWPCSVRGVACLLWSCQEYRMYTAI